MNNLHLEQILNLYLNTKEYKDIIPNGLQIEGKEKIKKITTGVTISQELIKKSIKLKSDAIIVHHGFFWKNEQKNIQNIKKIRLKTILSNDINIYNYHLPLDAHPIVGNNVMLGKMIDVKIEKFINPFLPIGNISNEITYKNLKKHLHKVLKQKPIYCGYNKCKKIKKIAWCTGNGKSFIWKAIEAKADAFITGEISEQIFYIAKEMKIHFYAAGHHATERFGIIELGNWINKKYDIPVEFIDTNNPI